MKGLAQLYLSKENVIEAIQDWLDKRWTVDSPVITNVNVVITGIENNFGQAILYLESNVSFIGAEERP